MYSFRNDYSEGAHPSVLKALADSNLRQTCGYGLDPVCQEAAALIRRLCGAPDADVHFLVGGTQTNLLAAEAFLKPYEAVIAAATGHVNVHETGAIEATGHKVCTVPAPDGKLTPERVASVLAAHSTEHMVAPQLVYLSNSTELGTVYNRTELEALWRFCAENGLTLYLDGARLGAALDAAGLALTDLPRLTDAFSIGGTKNGALFGEALMFSRPCPDFRWLMKRRGAMLAKGRLLGLQFNALLRDGLYERLASHANRLGLRLREGLTALGLPAAVESPTNQQFFILPDRTVQALIDRGYEFETDHPVDDSHTCVRFVTSWATPPEAVETFLVEIRACL